MSDSPPKYGFSHHHSVEQMLAYRRVPAEQKMEWLHAAWQLMVDAMPVKRRAAWAKLRRGEI